MTPNYHCAIFLLLLIFGILSCKPSTPPSEQKSNALLEREGISTETMQMLVNNCDQMDFLFHDLPISMNQMNKTAINQNIKSISTTALSAIPIECKPIARVIFYGKGEILIEGDIYVLGGCDFIVFIKDEQYLYANRFLPEGINYYHSILSQVAPEMLE